MFSLTLWPLYYRKKVHLLPLPGSPWVGGFGGPRIRSESFGEEVSLPLPAVKSLCCHKKVWFLTEIVWWRKQTIPSAVVSVPIYVCTWSPPARYFLYGKQRFPVILGTGYIRLRSIPCCNFTSVMDGSLYVRDSSSGWETLAYVFSMYVSRRVLVTILLCGYLVRACNKISTYFAWPHT
jgi:hypothetical protein